MTQHYNCCLLPFGLQFQVIFERFVLVAAFKSGFAIRLHSKAPPSSGQSAIVTYVTSET